MIEILLVSHPILYLGIYHNFQEEKLCLVIVVRGQCSEAQCPGGKSKDSPRT